LRSYRIELNVRRLPCVPTVIGTNKPSSLSQSEAVRVVVVVVVVVVVAIAAVCAESATQSVVNSATRHLHSKSACDGFH
jgi:hypothetical protein